MPREQSQRYCATCDRVVLVQRAVPNHLIHALVTIFTCLTWGVVWIAVSMRERPWRCAFCGGTLFVGEGERSALVRPDPRRGLAYRFGRFWRRTFDSKL